MKGAIEKQAMLELPGFLAKVLELPESKVEVIQRQGKNAPDFVVVASGYTFLVECKGNAARAPLLMALQQISNFKNSFPKDAIPLIAVPFMGPSGINFCRDHGLSWIDLSGNAHIKSPGILLHIEGRSNQYKKLGRPANVFAPKSARIARQLLIEPEKRYNQRELSQFTALDEGYTSRIVRRLEKLDLIERDEQGALRPSDPYRLLDAWFDVYDFSKHRVIKGHIAARSGEELLNQISQTLAEQKIDYAATGLAAAWQYTHFAKFRLVTIFLADPPGEDLFDPLHFRIDDRGANTWLVVPNDNGVFHGSSARDDIICVHPVQIYLDLKGHPERAKEAASMLHKLSLKWGWDA